MKHEPHSPEPVTKPANAATLAAAAKLSQAEAAYSPPPDEVARRAYFCYENQGSLPGHEVQHWLQAEADLIAERNLTRVHGYHNKT